MIAACALALCAAASVAQQRLELDDKGQFKPAAQTGEAAPESQKKFDADAASMSEIRRLLADGRISSARSKVDAWIDANVNEAAKARRSNPFAPEAYLLRGDCKLANDDEYDALFDYEEVVKTFPGSEQFVPSLERELRVANLYFNGRRKRTFGLRIDDATPIAEEIVIRINERLPGSRLAERAMLDLADYYYRQRDLRSATDTYDVFLRLFPKSEHRQLAMQRRTYSNIAQFKGPRYDGRPLISAKFQIDQFQTEFPADAERVGLSDSLATRMDESLAEQVLEQAKWYVRRDDLVSARVHLTRLIKRYPRSAAAASAATMLEQHGWPNASPDANEKEPIDAQAPEEPPTPAPAPAAAPATPPAPKDRP
jgi:TolA-binding protein